MLNLAELKRTLAIPGTTVKIIGFNVMGENRKHKFDMIPRTVKKLQTNSVCLVTEGGETSWMEFGKAANWVFGSGNIVTYHDKGTAIVYEILKGGENNNSVSG